MKIAISQSFSFSDVAELKRIRLSKGVSQKTLAEAAGLSRGAVTHIESGIRNPTLIVCHALAASLGVALSSILRRVERTAGASSSSDACQIIPDSRLRHSQ